MMRKIFTILLLLNFLFSVNILAQELRLYFSVNMSYQIELGNFDPSTDFVDIAGDFNSWGSILTILSDDNQDSIYSIAISGFSVQQSIAFKFRLNGVWDGTEEFSGGGPNRVYFITSESDSLYFWYNDQVSLSGPLQASFIVSGTEIKTESSVVFKNMSSGKVDIVQWFFEGGTPEFSAEQNPRIIYSKTGSYDVQLIVGNDNESDTLFLADYISVLERDKSQIDWWNSSVFYEIFVRSFYDSNGDGIGDFKGLTEIRVALEMEITPSARAYIGYRSLEIEVSEGLVMDDEIDLDDKGHIGVRFSF